MQLRVVVFHGSYGCDTGCCGHYIEVDEDSSLGGFYWDHPKSDKLPEALEFAQELVRKELGEEHVADLDWESCVIYDY